MKPSRQKKQAHPHKKIVTAAAVVAAAAAVLLAALCLRGRTEDDESLIAGLSAFQGSSRTVGQAEYDFFRIRASRSAGPDSSEEELDRLAREQIAAVSARFTLGNYLGLCEPYSFEALAFRMEQENLIRKAKMDSGEAVYGAAQFTLESYLDYLDSNLEADIVSCLVDSADRPMLEQARVYYDDHPSSFARLESVTYELEDGDGLHTTETLSSDELRSLQNTNSPLSDFLSAAQPGEVLEYQTANGAAQRATFVEARWETPEFDDAVPIAVRTWLNAEVMDSLYAAVAQNAPVVFDF